MPRKGSEYSSWLGTIAVRLPLNMLGDLYHAASKAGTDPATLVERALTEFLPRHADKTRTSERPRQDTTASGR
jgi:hypothetical protein